MSLQLDQMQNVKHKQYSPCAIPAADVHQDCLQNKYSSNFPQPEDNSYFQQKICSVSIKDRGKLSTTDESTGMKSCFTKKSRREQSTVLVSMI